MAGLLGGYMDPQQMGLLGLASSLLAASGPSRTPISLGQAFGQGLLSGNQLQQQAAQMQMQSKLAQAKLDEAALKKQEVERQLERERQLAGLIGTPPKVPDNYVETATPGTGLIGGISSGDPNAMQNFNTGLLALGGDYTKMGLKGLGVGTDTPSSVSEFRYWQSLSPAEQEQYLRVKRAQQFLDVGSGFVAPGMTDPTRVTPVAPKQLKPEDRPDTKAAQVTATETAKFEAEKKQKFPKARLALGSATQSANRVSSAIDKAIPLVSHWTAGLGGATLKDIPLTQARDLRAQIDTIKANIGFDELNAMRQSSPTGGALGQITERELDYLQSVLSNLEQSQSPEQLRHNLETAKEEIRQSWERVREAYEQDYGPSTTAPKEQQKEKPKAGGIKFLGFE